MRQNYFNVQIKSQDKINYMNLNLKIFKKKEEYL